MDEIFPIYFETSAVNHFAKKCSIEDAKKFKITLELSGKRAYISPVVLWEILSTSNDIEKEYIIQFAQNFFYNKIPLSPSEFIVNYIESGCPIEEMKYDFHSKLGFAPIWEEICEDTRKTFIYDKQEIKHRIKLVQNLASLLRNFLTNESLDIKKTKELIGTQIMFESIYNSISFVKAGEHITPEKKRRYKTSIFFILFILCSEATFDNEPIINFWKKRGIKNIIERLQYIMKNHEVLIQRGPFIQMAFMANNQFKTKKSRGMLMDCYHSFYLPYFKLFMTADKHFETLINEFDHQNHNKVLHVDKFEKIIKKNDISNS